MNARELTDKLGGRWHGSYGMAPCPSHNDSTPSLAIRQADNGKKLICCHAGCQQHEVIDALKDRGLWGAAGNSIRPDTVNMPSRDDEIRERIEAVNAIWQRCDAADATYLRARGITLEIPPSIRFAPALKHCPTGLFLPCMVAAVQAPDRTICSIHRTYLTADTNRKAGVLSPKMALGPLGSGAVRLAAAGEVLGLAEGIETSLSAMQLFNVPVWAALGSRLHAVAVPPEVREVRIYADNGDAGHEAARKAVETFTKQGKRVLVQYPPPEFGDFNDILVKRSAA